MSAGMLAYVRALRTLLPRVAPDLQLAEFGSGDNFDAAEQLGMPLALARLRPRLVHFPSPFVPRVVPAPHVVTVHDVIDLEFPQYAKRKVGPYFRQVVGPVLRSARAVITDDDATVALLERYLRVDPARVRVVPLGVDAPDPLPDPDRAAAAVSVLRRQPPPAQGSRDARRGVGVAAGRRRGRLARSPGRKNPRCAAFATRAASWSFSVTAARTTSGAFIAARSRTCIPRCAKASGCRCSRRCAWGRP